MVWVRNIAGLIFILLLVFAGPVAAPAQQNDESNDLLLLPEDILQDNAGGP